MRELRTVADVIKALGGASETSRIASRTRPRTPQAVSNWRRYKTLPPTTYLLLTEALEERGFSASPKLWGME